MTDNGSGDVHPRHARAAFGQEAGVVALAAADVRARETVHVREHGEKGGGVEAVAVVVVPGPDQGRPRLGVLVPVPTDSFVVHATVLPAGCGGALVSDGVGALCNGLPKRVKYDSIR